MSCAMVGW